MKSQIGILSCLVLCLSCGGFSEEETLAKRYCATCHLFPDPTLLDKTTWNNGIFPEMAFRMGMDISRLPDKEPAELNEILKAIPVTPMISEREWSIIKTYYLTLAPDSIQSGDAPKTGLLDSFTATPIKLPISGKTMLTLVHWDSLQSKHIVGTRAGKLFTLAPSFVPEDSIQLNSPPSDFLRTSAGTILVTCMGNMDPNDQPIGSVIRMIPERRQTETLADSIKRPVDLQVADMNNDGEDDMIVSAFGNFTGALLAYEKKGDTYRKHIIHHFPGNRKTIVRDFNGDGLKDVLALVTQGDEQIALFTNLGKFNFSYQVLLKFPPAYGSSYVELADFNSDGHPDILYSNGDNADYSPILKPYHGLRIYLNDGRNQFRESWFFPMHGASRAQVHDFDQDGDPDIAAISFFPDFRKHPEHGFLYFENDDGKFTPFHTPAAASSRWITMESADIDHDGDTDLILGALTFPDRVPGNLLKKWRENEVSLLVLRNNLY